MIVALAEDSRVRKYDEAIFLGRSNASVVQMVERLFCTEDVWSSILHTGSRSFRGTREESGTPVKREVIGSIPIPGALDSVKACGMMPPRGN